jgi:hypothetical protein
MLRRSLKNERRTKALSALGVAGVSLALASGASASTGDGMMNTPSISQAGEIFLGEEEISDVSLATFYVFDRENTGRPPLTQKLRVARCRRGCGCGGCGGCGSRSGCTGCGGGVDGYP